MDKRILVIRPVGTGADIAQIEDGDAAVTGKGGFKTSVGNMPLTPDGPDVEIPDTKRLTTTDSGTINLPNNAMSTFEVEGVNVGPTVIAVNLDRLTDGDPNANDLHQHYGLGALWLGTRYYAVDYDGGNDANLGYSDLSMAAAGTVALKTLEHLLQIFPKYGNGQSAVIAVKTRKNGFAYRNIANTADDDLELVGVTGYRILLVRATDNIASASSVAFANDAADKVSAGAQLVPGTNGPGYNPTGVPTVNTFTCSFSGGGGPALAVEPALLGKRIRFDSATTTVALRNVCAMIWMNSPTKITVSSDLPIAPALTDVFYIEEPGCAVNRVIVQSSNQTDLAAPPAFVFSGIEVVGFRAVAAVQPCIEVRGNTAGVGLSFLDSPNSAGFANVTCSDVSDLRIQNTYTDESLGVITPGVGIRTGGGITTARVYSLSVLSHSACIATRFQILDSQTYNVGAGCYALMGALFQGCGQAITSVGALSSNIIGRGTILGVQAFRSVSTFNESINFTRSHGAIYGCDLTGAGGNPLIYVNGTNNTMTLNDVTGSLGNTGVGLELVNARDCKISAGLLAKNTFTATAGRDIAGAGPVYYTHADYVLTDLWDANGNKIQGLGQTILGSVVFASNNGVLAIGQYAVTRCTASGAIQVAQADTAANAAGVVGVSQSPASVAESTMIANAGGTWLRFDALPAAGAIAYLSEVTAGNARDTPPPFLALNRKLRLGRILRVSGTLGFVSWHPENLSVLSDGLA